ncbi:NAD(P)H dehydrogenase (quinone) [Actinoalloteichus hoggarensis]|uniref:Quinone oxidoreductase 2 n=1 Tax=Actinoalloteichus hoggarensis TaxID=1470176 RepID=A0A221W6V1_9PSEU|nr:hypothetical protein [Actinoalloteichus hoggarensis]ASO21491.1 Quinone oxidoreductase 2 [Actinoalloteichus hoggarensis]MBB5922080.1 NAD(P)H dehydrogenase (quinone) [Actinoalloteichus hoggarensis]
MIVVVGADQLSGVAVVARLRAAGIAHRAVPLGVPTAGGTPSVAEFEKTLVEDGVLDGADGLLIAPNPNGAEAPDGGAALLTGVIDRAVAAGASRVVYLSIAAAHLSPMVFHARTEEHLRSLDVEHTVLRLGLTLEVFRPLIRHAAETGELPAPEGAARFAAASRPDVAAAAVAALTGEFAGPMLDVTGDRAFDLTELAAAVATAADRPVRRTVAPDAELLRTLVSTGMPEPAAGALLGMIRFGENGVFGAVSPHLRALLGGPGTELAAAVRPLLA